MSEARWCLRNKRNGKPVAVGLLDKQLIVGLDSPVELCNWWEDKNDAEWLLEFFNRNGDFDELRVDVLTENEELSIPAIRDAVRLEEAIQAFKDLGGYRMTLTEFSKFIQELRRSNTDPMATVGISIGGGNEDYDMDEVLLTITDRKGRMWIRMDETEERFDGTFKRR